MVIKSISKGLFYTIGRILAYLLIGLIIGFIVSKIDTSNVNLNELIKGVLC